MSERNFLQNRAKHYEQQANANWEDSSTGKSMQAYAWSIVSDQIGAANSIVEALENLKRVSERSQARMQRLEWNNEQSDSSYGYNAQIVASAKAAAWGLVRDWNEILRVTVENFPTLKD